jgi:hypothetical protein
LFFFFCFGCFFFFCFLLLPATKNITKKERKKKKKRKMDTAESEFFNLLPGPDTILHWRHLERTVQNRVEDQPAVEVPPPLFENGRQAVLPENRRLLPSDWSQREALHTPQHKLSSVVHSAVVVNKGVVAPNSDLDLCRLCQVLTVVDRVASRRVCPNCAHTEPFASHVLETKEEKVMEGSIKKQNSNLRDFLKQWERGSQSITWEQAAALNRDFTTKIHFRNRGKVTNRRVASFMQNKRKQAERVRRELTGASIPEFTKRQSNYFINHVLPSNFKSNNNQNLLRKFAHVPGMGPARLFAKGKSSNHLDPTKTG